MHEPSTASYRVCTSRSRLIDCPAAPATARRQQAQGIDSDPQRCVGFGEFRAILDGRLLPAP